jgi:hypothetical protein
VDPVHQLLIDQLVLLPQRAGSRRFQLADRIDQVCGQERAEPPARVLPAQPGDDPVIEAVDGTPFGVGRGPQDAEKRGVEPLAHLLHLDPDFC